MSDMIDALPLLDHAADKLGEPESLIEEEVCAENVNVRIPVMLCEELSQSGVAETLPVAD